MPLERGLLTHQYGNRAVNRHPSFRTEDPQNASPSHTFLIFLFSKFPNFHFFLEFLFFRNFPKSWNIIGLAMALCFDVLTHPYWCLIYARQGFLWVFLKVIEQNLVNSTNFDQCCIIFRGPQSGQLGYCFRMAIERWTVNQNRRVASHRFLPPSREPQTSKGQIPKPAASRARGAYATVFVRQRAVNRQTGSRSNKS